MIEARKKEDSALYKMQFLEISCNTRVTREVWEFGVDNQIDEVKWEALWSIQLIRTTLARNQLKILETVL